MTESFLAQHEKAPAHFPKMVYKQSLVIDIVGDDDDGNYHCLDTNALYEPEDKEEEEEDKVENSALFPFADEPVSNTTFKEENSAPFADEAVSNTSIKEENSAPFVDEAVPNMSCDSIEVRGSTWVEDLMFFLAKDTHFEPVQNILRIYPSSPDDSSVDASMLNSLRSYTSITDVYISIPVKSVALELVLNSLPSITSVFVEAISPNASFNVHSNCVRTLELIDYPIPSEDSFLGQVPPVMFHFPKLELIVDGHGCFAFTGLSSGTKPRKMILEDISEVPLRRSDMYAYLSTLMLKELHISDD